SLPFIDRNGTAAKPAADHAPGFVDVAGHKLEAFVVQVAFLVADPEEYPQFLQLKVCPSQDCGLVPGVARLDDLLKNVEGEVIYARGNCEADPLGKFLGAGKNVAQCFFPEDEERKLRGQDLP